MKEEWVPNTECDVHEFLLSTFDYIMTEMKR